MQTFTITFSDRVENHQGMQILGDILKDGYTLEELNNAKNWFEARNNECELINLKDYILNLVDDNYDAYILIIRNGLNSILHTSSDFFNEQNELEKDTKVYMRGAVKNKLARYNLCFADVSQEPDYENKKGRVVAFEDVPLLNKVRVVLHEIMNTDKAKNLYAEGNYYYDINKCGIGFHGDSERKTVIGIRVGASMPLHFQWFQKSIPIGERCELLLHDADIYIMSERATGFNWKKRLIPTLRHAAGCKKYLTIKNK